MQSGAGRPKLACAAHVTILFDMILRATSKYCLSTTMVQADFDATLASAERVFTSKMLFRLWMMGKRQRTLTTTSAASNHESTMKHTRGKTMRRQRLMMQSWTWWGSPNKRKLLQKNCEAGSVAWPCAWCVANVQNPDTVVYRPV
eukprot:5957363-Amphidinium_carterae.1